MPQDYSNITGGLKNTTQIPLDVKSYIQGEGDLADLGSSNNLAFTYTEGQQFYCIDEKTRWEWREVETGEELTGLRPTDYTYPSGVSTFNIDYSGRKFNFFPIQLSGSNGADGVDGLNGATWTTGSGIPSNGVGVNNDLYLNTANGDIYKKIAGSYTIIANIKGANGTNGTNGTNGIDASNNLQKTLTYPASFTGTNYTLTSADNNYTVIISNGSTNVTVTVPTGLITNINVCFIQQGTGTVTFVQSSTTINSPSSMKKIKDQHYWAYIEQIGTSNVYQLLGSLKV